MYILYESDVKRNIERLEQAWTNSETFLFLSDRNGLTSAWLEHAIAQLSELFKDHHFILLTSGSTGRPKLVVGSRKRAEQLSAILHLSQDSEFVKETVVLLPLTYCYAFVNQWLWAREKRRKLIFTDGFKRPDDVYSALTKTRDCLLCAVGPVIQMFKKNFGEDVSFPGIIRLHFAGGIFPQDEVNFLRKLFPNALIFNNYGCAEAMPRLTIRSLEESDDANNIGKPIFGVQLMRNETGELLFRSKYQAKALYDDTGLFIPGEQDWIPTGDIGESIDGEYWRINGRKSEVFKRYGEKISLLQLLETVKTFWKGQAVFYRERDKSGEEGHVLVLEPIATKDQVQNILQIFRLMYSRTHWPLRIESIKSLPLLSNGKVDLIFLAKTENKTIHWRQRI